MDKYTIESFEKWLNADESRKRGLKIWGWVLQKVRSDPDLFAALKTGKNQGGWNVSDPEFRKQYTTSLFDFESYYQVFLEWRKEMDAQEEQEQEEWETSSTASSDSFYSAVGEEEAVPEFLSNLDKVSFYDNKGIYYPDSTGKAIYYKLEENDLKKVKTAFIKQVIKKNPAEWKAKEEQKIVLAGMNMRGKVSLLVHNSFKVERDWWGSLKIDCGKVQYQNAFTAEEWRGIENILTNHQNKQTENNKSNWPWSRITKYGVIGVIILIVGLVLWQWIKKANGLVFEKK